MDKSIIIMGIVMVAIAVVPFIIISIRSRKKQSKEK